MNKGLFEVDDNTKDILKKISATFGTSYDDVRQVWEMTVFTYLLKMAKSSDGLMRFTIPFIGTMAIRCNGFKMEDGKIVPDMESFLSLNENFKSQFSLVQGNSYGALSDYVDSYSIDGVIENIE